LEHLTALESLELADLPELRFDETQGEEEKRKRKRMMLRAMVCHGDALLNVSAPWNYVLSTR